MTELDEVEFLLAWASYLMFVMDVEAAMAAARLEETE